ncbi:MAG: Gldg family protein [Oscillospiraceae bacterium]|nr:Gldg family protein [Oscillospiraceae bacterium]
MDNSIFAKNKRYKALALLLAVLVLAVAIPVNLIVERLNIHFDMTPNNLYTLSKTTEDYLDELDARGEVVDVYFLTEMDNLAGDLEWLALYRTLLAYDAHKCFNLIDFDPDSDPETLRRINPDGVFNLSEADFLFVHDDMVKRLPGTLMYTYETDDNGKVVNAEFRAENYFTGYIKTVVDGELPIVYFLEGHNELSLDDMSQLAANLGNYNYGAKALNLTTAAAVPDDCCILVIAGPQFDINEDEYKKIYDYTQKGGNVSLLIGPNEAKSNYTNIERLMSSYCLGMNYDRVSETDENRHSHNDTYAMMCNIAEANSESGINLTADLLPTVNNIGTYMPYSRSFYTTYGTNYGAMKIDSLIVTDPTAQSEPWGGKQLDPLTVTGKALPLAMYSMDTQRSDSKLVVFGSADIISNTGSGNAYFINPLQLFLSTITWMYDSDVDMNIANKARTYDSIDINSSATASSFIALFIAFPLLIALTGVIIWLRRKNA